MAINPSSRPLTRQELSEFLPNHRAIVAFEQAQVGADTASVTANASILTVLDEEPTLPNSRRVQADAPITVTDTGAGGVLSFGLANTPVVPGAYGSASKTVSFIVTSRGRLQVAAEYPLNTSNITEGGNLFYTDARARAALSGSTGITYNNATGAIAQANTAVTPGVYGSPTQVGEFIVDQQGNLVFATNTAINLGGFTGTVSPVTSITVSNGIVVAVS